MPQNLPHVRPGDLITAAFINAVLQPHQAGARL